MDDVTKKQPEAGAAESSVLLEQLNSCQAQLQLWKEDCLRSRAEFENYKKRVERDREQAARMMVAGIVKDLLPLIDDVERGLTYAQTLTSAEGKALLAGLQLTYDQFKKVLSKYGVAPIADAIEFDPMLHEAVMEVESPDHQPGTIVQVVQKGYQLQGQVIRPAKVTVAKGQ